MILIEHGGIEVRKELVVQLRDYVVEIRPGHNKPEIEARGALRNHSYIFVPEYLEGSTGDSRSVADVLAYQAHDGLILLNAQFGELSNLARNGGETFAIVNG